MDAKKQITPNLIKQFRNLSEEIKQKTEECKKTKANKNACSPLNIFKQNQLSKQLDSLTEKIQKLKSDKEFVLYELGCKTENDVNTIEQNYKYNLDAAEKLKARNSDLQTEYTTEKANYIEIRNDTPPENAETVQPERYDVRNRVIKRICNNLQKAYREKYSHDIFREA